MNAEPQVYEWKGPTGVQFKQVRSEAGTYYHDETPVEVRRILDGAIRSGKPIRIWTGDTKTGKCWNDEFDVYGRVSRSMGPIKIPILVKTSRSMGGGAISDRSIIAIADRPGHFLYRHQALDLGKWTEGKPVSDGYTSAAYVNGELHAQFKAPDGARRHIGFMLWDRFSK